MPQSVSPVKRSISARTLASNLQGVLNFVDRLQLVQQKSSPRVKPAWWNDHTRDREWRSHAPNCCEVNRHNREEYVYWRCNHALLAVLNGFDALAAGADLTPHEQQRVQDAKIGLGAMSFILSAAPRVDRWMLCVVPEAAQLEGSLPGIWTPKGPSKIELRLENRIRHVTCESDSEKTIDKLTATTRVKAMVERRNQLREARERKNRLSGRGKVTIEYHRTLERLKNNWRDIIDTWNLARQSVDLALSCLTNVDPGTAVVELGNLPESVMKDFGANGRNLMAQSGLGTPQTKAPPPPSPTGNCMQKRGAVWEVIYDGTSSIPKLSKGLVYIRLMVQFPGKLFSFQELGEEDTPSDIPLSTGCRDAAVDRETLLSYKKHLEDIHTKIDEAARMNDTARLNAAMEEKSELILLINKVAFKGRVKTHHSEARNLRQRVVAAITRTLKELKDSDPKVAAHLNESICLDGGGIYRPKATTHWSI
jgi:hypothetical protein